MDGPADDRYSRAPELEDLETLCRSLHREGVRYVLIGGFAVILHGLARTTKDVDLLVDPSLENVRALKRAMASLPDNAIALIEDDELQRYPVVRVADEITVDLLTAACGVTYVEAIRDVQSFELGGVRVPVASKELLIRTKDTVRDSDKADVGFLRLALAEERRKRGGDGG